MPIKHIISLFVLVFSLSGCSYLYDKFVYQINVTQGNYIDDGNLAKIKVGMTQEQVIYILGSPMLIDQFDASKWYYIRYIKPGGKKAQQENAVLTFKGKILTSIEHDGDIAKNPLEVHKEKNEPNKAAENSDSDNKEKVATSSDVISE